MQALATRVSRLTVRQRLMLLTVVSMLVMPMAAFAQTEEPMSVGEIITSASGVINDFNLMPFITVAAVVGVAVYLFARIRRSAR